MRRATSSPRGRTWWACAAPARFTTTTVSKTGVWPLTGRSPISMRPEGRPALLLVVVALVGAAATQPVEPSPSPVALATPRPAPEPAAAGTFGFGRLATADDIKKIDIDVRADGAGLPPGSGTAVQGQPIYAQQCASCH